jgi:mannan endo-1,4-beta-mannosidase
MKLIKYFRALQMIFIFALGISFVNAAGFVDTDGTEFVMDDNPFYFSGANNYYLFYKPVTQVQEVMDDANSLGLKVIRTWGFCDGTCTSGNYNSFQSSPGVYPEATFQKFDRVIKEASDRGLKLTVPLVNNWDEFGGMCQYAKWCNLTNANLCDADEPWPFEIPTQVHDQFYSNSCTKQIYKNYVNHFLNRNNTLTGVLYKNDPTIFAWELANEPRARSDTSTVTLNNWIGEMSAYVKTIDSNHMVTPGSDGGYKDKASNPTWSWWYHGNEGQDYITNHQWSSVDFATFRYYPEAGKFDDVNPQLWILEHIDDAHYVIGKPVVMEEFGSFVNKSAVLANYYNQLETHGANGDTFWILVDHLATGNDGYFVSCPEDTAVCNVISNHASYMNNMSVECSTDYECDYLDAGYCDANRVMHDEGRCIVGQCQAETTAIENCDDSNPLTVDTCLANLTCSHVQQIQTCVVPYDGMKINQSTIFCRGNYNLPIGINVTANDVVLDCNKSVLTGNSAVYTIRSNGYTGITIKDCAIKSTSGIYAIGNSITLRNNNLTSGEFNTVGDATQITDNTIPKITSKGSGLLISGNILNLKYDHTIYLNGVSNSQVINNTVTCASWGRCISLDTVGNTLFESNTVHDGGSAFYCWYGCNNNMFTGNSMLRNQYAISGDYNTNYYGNTICKNNITSNVNDLGLISGTTNKWNCSTEGNHWSRYDNPIEGCQNLNGDKLCDSPYNIGVSGYIDNFPYTDYDQSEPVSCTVPYSGMNITKNTILCKGTYYLGNTTEKYGINIRGDFITLDCNDSTLIRNRSLLYPFNGGIRAFRNQNVTIKNCNLLNYTDGIFLDYSRNGAFLNNHIIGLGSGYDSKAINAEGSWSDKYINNKLENSNFGIRFNRGEDCEVINNSFDNMYYALSMTGVNNTFWLNRFTNIGIYTVDGWEKWSYFDNGSIGNYWDEYDEESEGCYDMDENGICDSLYNLSFYYDRYPLTNPEGIVSEPICTVPQNSMVISENTIFCAGDYEITDGIQINNNNVALDCNGANIMGSGSGIGISAQGIYNLEQWANATNNLQNMSALTQNVTGFVDSISFIDDISIVNCNIQGFENGMNLTAIKNLELRNNVVHDNNAGIIYGAYLGTITDNKAYNNQNGIVGAGINLTIENNEVYGSNMAMIVAGIGNSVSGNNIHDNPGTGISIGGFDNVVYNNNAKNNAGNDGISLTYSVGADVYNNTAESNGRAGISIIEGSNNTVSDNIMRNNRFGFGMQGLFSQGPSSGNVISNNVITDNTESGIALHDGVIWDIAKLLFGSNVKIKGHRVIENEFNANYLDNTVDLFVYGPAVRNNNIFGNDFYGGGVTGPGENNYCVGSVGNNYYNGAQEAPGEC